MHLRLSKNTAFSTLTGLILMQKQTSLELIKPKPPASPSMTLLTKREESFKSWPVGLNHIDTKAMARAGFFYTGKYSSPPPLDT
jgi:hypothetical protein